MGVIIYPSGWYRVNRSAKNMWRRVSSVPLCCYSPVSICTWFWNLYFMKLIFELDFLSISNLIFTACVACKNPLRNRQKIKLNNQVRKLQISKIKFRSARGMFISIYYRKLVIFSHAQYCIYQGIYSDIFSRWVRKSP